MRIVGGKHRSRTLFTPKDNAVRPTSDKVRQAVFNILNSRGLVVDAIVIDAIPAMSCYKMQRKPNQSLII